MLDNFDTTINQGWSVPLQVMEYLEYEIGCYDFQVLHQRPFGVLLQANSVFLTSKSSKDPQPQAVVIKIVSLETKRLKSEFKREVKINTRLQRSAPLHVCKLLKSKRIPISMLNGGQEVGVMIMERMEMDLMDYILNSKFIPISTIKMIFKVICQSVLECHKQGITHLDLKPENILLNLLGRAITDIKLCDFGCSFQHHHHTSFPSSISTLINKKYAKHLEVGKFGTIEYLPPEYIASTSSSHGGRTFQATEKIDVYSLGVILFVMMSKRFPKVYATDANGDVLSHSLVDSTQGDYFECLKSFNRGCSKECADLIASMMNDDFEVRPTLSEVLSHPYFS